MYTLQLKAIVLGIFLSTILSAKEGFLCEFIDESHGVNTEHKTMDDKKRLIVLAQNYLKFVDEVGSASSVPSNDPRMESLFAEDLTKIDNRLILFEKNRQLLLPQMRGFKKEYDPQAKQAAWTVDKDNALIIPSVETNSVIVYFEWTHVNVGRATTMAILQCNANGQIERITDVWAPIPVS